MTRNSRCIKSGAQFWAIRHFFSLAGEDLILQVNLADSASKAILLHSRNMARSPDAYYDVLQASGLQQNFHGFAARTSQKKDFIQKLNKL